MNGLYRADLWRNADHYCEVWTESRSLAGVIQDECEELAVSLYPAGGFSSITLAFEAADFINQSHDGRDVVIFYIGDYDPAGVLIDVALERELRAHLSPDITLHFERIGITEEQIAHFDLPTKPRKEGDRRSAQVRSTVEAEAMPAAIMRHLLRSRIEALLPPDALAIAKAAEESERTMIDGLAGMLEARGMSALPSAARVLNGNFVGGAILCPGPGHSARDRSLKVWLGPDGQPRVHSFAATIGATVSTMFASASGSSRSHRESRSHTGSVRSATGRRQPIGWTMRPRTRAKAARDLLTGQGHSSRELRPDARRAPSAFT